MLQRMTEADLLRLEFSDFCHAQGDLPYDFTCYFDCAVLRFRRSRGGALPRHHRLFHYAAQRPWNFKALAARLTERP
jgi:hypothetical protein